VLYIFRFESEDNVATMDQLIDDVSKRMPSYSREVIYGMM